MSEIVFDKPSYGRIATDALTFEIHPDQVPEGRARESAERVGRGVSAELERSIERWRASLLDVQLRVMVQRTVPAGKPEPSPLLALLEKHQWGALRTGSRVCPECGSVPAGGHDSDCPWAAQIRALGGTPRMQS